MARPSLPRIAIAIALGALASIGCLSPTLPVPPPDVPDSIHETAAGHWRIAGDCTPGARVTVLDVRTGRGAVVEDLTRTGRYVVEIEAAPCDTAWVAQEVDEQQSGQTGFVIRDHASDGTSDAGACP
jgi:hypothetical protein